MASLKLAIFKVPDRELLASLARIAGEMGAASTPFNLQLAEGQNQAHSVAASTYLDDPFVKSVVASDAAIIWRVSFSHQSRGIRVDRGAATDEAHISFPDGAADVQIKNAQFLASIHNHLRTYGRTAATDEVLGHELAEFYRQRESALHRLEQLAQTIIETNEAHRVRAEERAEALRTKLASEHQQRMDALQADYTAREQRLVQREQDLDTRISELDDRSSKHARRQLRQDVKAIIAQRSASFRLSRDTTRKRWPIHALFLGLVLATATMFALTLTGYLPIAPGIPAWISALRLPVIAAALAASLIFYIRWSDHWFRQHADEEMRLKRLELDIDRASWVVEMALEWKDEKGSELPAELVDRLSRNLFERDTALRATHPSEDLASALLGASAGLTLNIPGLGEAKVDRKGMRQFKKALDGENNAG